MGAWTVCRFKGGLGKKAGSGVFEGLVDTPMHTMKDLHMGKHITMKKFFRILMKFFILLLWLLLLSLLRKYEHS